MEILINEKPEACTSGTIAELLAHRLTVRHFGRTIHLFMPLYLSNQWTNQCAYCGFIHNHTIIRKTLSLAQIEEEAIAIAETGMRHVLFLTGELPPKQYYTLDKRPI